VWYQSSSAAERNRSGNSAIANQHRRLQPLFRKRLFTLWVFPFSELFVLEFVYSRHHLAGASNESCIPASLTAARFDPNSSRHLSDFLGTVGLSHYSGKKFNFHSFLFNWIIAFLILYFFTDLFLRNEIDMTMFTTLKDEDLIVQHRRHFVRGSQNIAQCHSG
jgi:hypothetical protein